jgi:two-component sensor histidine kinase
MRGTAKVREVGRTELLEREILAIADREKERLGRELHDGLCQSLAGIAALSSALSRRLAAGAQPGPAAAADEIVRLLSEAIGEARDLAHGLYPTCLNGAGLVSRLETLARNVRSAYDASCTFTSTSGCSCLREETVTHLVRIAQEAVRNAITHGRADQIDICLQCVDGSGLLSIWDNGVGLSEDHRNHDGIGLHTMGYRARAIGASLTVDAGKRRSGHAPAVERRPRTATTPARAVMTPTTQSSSSQGTPAWRCKEVKTGYVTVNGRITTFSAWQSINREGVYQRRGETNAQDENEPLAGSAIGHDRAYVGVRHKYRFGGRVASKRGGNL